MNVTAIIGANAAAQSWRLTWVAIVASSFAACSGGIGSNSTTGAGAVTQYTVSGTVSGLTGSGLMLDNNGTDDVTISADGTFTFAIALVPGDSYSISIRNQPTAPNQTCTVKNGSGTVTGGNITGLAVTCVNKTSVKDFIGGTIEGLLGSGLVLQNNLGDNLAVSANGGFAFATQLVSGNKYSVSVLSPPINPYENCVVANGGGTVGGNDVLNVAVTCKTNPNPTFSISGMVSGLSAGSTIILQNNGRDDQTIAAGASPPPSIPFHFAMPIPTGSGYSVTSKGATGQQSQACAITNASGTVAGANVANVTVTCIPNANITATVSGLAAESTLVLQNNLSDDLTVTQNGLVTFPTAVAIGSTYSVSIKTQPGNQTCMVKNGTGTTTVAGSTKVVVTCGVATFPIGGTVTGLIPDPTTGAYPTGLVLLDNGGDNLNITTIGPFTFSSPILSGGTYGVTISSEPPGYACAVANGVGVVNSAAISGVAVSCSSIGGLLYVTNGGGNSISGFAIDGLTGMLQPLTQVVAATGQPNAIVAAAPGSHPTSVIPGCLLGAPTLDPTIYVADPGSGTIAGFSVNNTFAATGFGALTPTEGSPVAAGKSLTYLDFIVASPLCELYALDTGLGNISEFAAGSTGLLNPSNGSPVALGTNSVPVAAANAAGFTANFTPLTFEYVAGQVTNDVSAFLVDPTAGTLSPINDPAGLNTIAAGTKPSAIATDVIFEVINTVGFFVPYVYVANQGSNDISIYRGDPVTGGLAVLGDRVPAGNGPTAVTNIFNFLYVANGLDNTISAYTIDTSGSATTGTLTSVGTPTATGSGPVAMAVAGVNNSFNFSTKYCLYVVNSQSNDVYVYGIDTTTGALTFIAKYPVGAAPTSIAIPYLLPNSG